MQSGEIPSASRPLHMFGERADGNVLKGIEEIRVLVAEDDAGLWSPIVAYLGKNGMAVMKATTAAEVYWHIKNSTVDLLLLDLAIEHDDGLAVLRTIRSRHDIPVILMTGDWSDEANRVVGLELGADDCLLKTLSLRELLARIRSVLRRSISMATSTRKEMGISRFGSWTLDRRGRRLLDGAGELVPLTKGEYALLTAFTERPRQILSREQLLLATRVHGDILDRSIDVQVLRLRRKLERDASARKLIRTERRLGYSFDIDVKRTDFD